MMKVSILFHDILFTQITVTRNINPCCTSSWPVHTSLLGQSEITESQNKNNKYMHQLNTKKMTDGPIKIQIFQEITRFGTKLTQ